MKDANYYYNQMNYYNNEINIASEKKRNYELLLEKTNRLLDGLPDARSDLINAENFFLDGGYIDDLGTFDRGQLKEIYNYLNDDIWLLDEIIDFINGKIMKLNNKIIEYRNCYNSANDSYKKIFIKENGD